MTEVVMDEDWKTRAEKAEAERDEARAELQRQQRLRTSEAGKYLGDVAALRGEVERLRRQLEDWKHSLVEQEKVSEAFMCERDAMREALEGAKRYLLTRGVPGDGPALKSLNAALATDAGAAMLERVRVAERQRHDWEKKAGEATDKRDATEDALLAEVRKAEAERDEALRTQRDLLTMFRDLRPALEATDEQPIVAHAWRVREERDALRAEVERQRQALSDCVALLRHLEPEVRGGYSPDGALAAALRVLGDK